jgi:transcriptional regulator with XRE-family HTH domain
MNPRGSQALRQAAVTYAAIVGRIVLHRRKGLGLNQVDVANALGVSQGSYSKMETGEIPITLEVLQRISAHFGCTPTAVLQEADGYLKALQLQGVQLIGAAELKSEPDLKAALVLGLALLAALIAGSR